MYYDVEQQEFVSENQLRLEYKAQIDGGWIEDMTFEEYVFNCLTKNNGNLEKV